MSEAFAEAEAAAHEEEAEDLIVGEEEADAEEGAEAEAEEKPAKDWEKIAHDKEGVAAKERSQRRAAVARTRELEARLEKLESSSKPSDEDALEKLASQLRDDDEDPIEDLATAKAIIRQFVNAQKTEREQGVAQTAQQRATRAVISTMEDHEADFREDHPDYNDAAKHYRAQRQEELEEIGYSGQALQSALAQDLFGVVKRAIEAGKDPAESVYNLAKKRGFAASTATAEATLKKIQEGQKAGLKPSGGVGNKGPLTWGDVAKLSGAARDAAFAKLRESERRAG